MIKIILIKSINELYIIFSIKITLIIKSFIFINIELIIKNSIIKDIAIDEIYEIISIKDESSKRRRNCVINVSKLRIVNLINVRSMI